MKTHMHNASNPRHQRLFEFLRQMNQAESTAARVQDFDIRRVSGQEAKEFQSAAYRSLKERH